MKRITTIFVAFLSVVMFAVSVSATSAESNKTVEIEPTRYQYVADAVCNLTISGTTATCESSATRKTGTSSISAVQTLEKHWGLGIFFAVDNASWTKSVQTKKISMSNIKSGLSSGTYRLRTDITVTTANGQSETITVYSGEKTIN